MGHSPDTALSHSTLHTRLHHTHTQTQHTQNFRPHSHFSSTVTYFAATRAPRQAPQLNVSVAAPRECDSAVSCIYSCGMYVRLHRLQGVPRGGWLAVGGGGGNSGNGECGSMSSWVVVIALQQSDSRFHQVADLTITFSLLLPLYHVESAIFQSQNTIQVSTC